MILESASAITLHFDTREKIAIHTRLRDLPAHESLSFDMHLKLTWRGTVLIPAFHAISVSLNTSSARHVALTAEDEDIDRIRHQGPTVSITTDVVNSLE